MRRALRPAAGQLIIQDCTQHNGEAPTSPNADSGFHDNEQNWTPTHSLVLHKIGYVANQRNNGSRLEALRLLRQQRLFTVVGSRWQPSLSLLRQGRPVISLQPLH